MALPIDNYDSFTYNLALHVQQFARDIKVIRNDKITVKEVLKMNPDCLLISPAPGRPEHTGIGVQHTQTVRPMVPILEKKYRKAGSQSIPTLSG